MAPTHSGLEFTMPSAPNSPTAFEAIMDPYAAGYYGSTPEGDSVSSASGIVPLADPVSSPDSVPDLVDPANDGDTTVIASPGTGFPLEARQASSSTVDAQPASSLWVDAWHGRLPTSNFGYGSDEGCVASSDNSRSHDPANDVGLAPSLDDEDFVHPHHMSLKHSSSTISNKGLSSKPLYFPEWFDNASSSKRKWSDSVEDEDDLGDIPKSWMN
jgi:hypothetical protein